MDALGRMIWQLSEHVGEPGLRIDVVELRGCDECVDSSRSTATFVRAGEGPVAAPSAMARSSRSAALLDMHRRPSSRKRVSALQRLRL